jgi:hypothetical protein
MPTYSIQFDDAQQEKVTRLLEFVRSLDFVKSVEPAPSAKSKKALPKIETSGNSPFYSVEELKGLFPNQWVLLANFQKNGAELLGGQVLTHDADKRTFALNAAEFVKNEKNLTHFFTGEVVNRSHSGVIRKISQ